ncbi:MULTISPECIES: MinD/ParA family ATP-binding protein [unclassified Solwaraspora]|uniref:MinD/ParA family ATP-binding protein n=1 Tax=unclassified Solwaraspora TaxID=2627926 RepID=UPI00259B7BE4|nr:AAA family ATPase [Solwaraspora sp. WMMA2056]WJK38086.1 AAA family ATPase [Solwaraspora sp. WMMA2056]
MEGTENGWGRPAEPPPRWRALLDRARLGGRTGEHPEVDDRNGTGTRPQDNGQAAAPAPHGSGPGRRPDGGSGGPDRPAEPVRPSAPSLFEPVPPPAGGRPYDPGPPPVGGYPYDTGPPMPGAGRYAALAPGGAQAGYAPAYPVVPGTVPDRDAVPVRPVRPAPPEPGPSPGQVGPRPGQVVGPPPGRPGPPPGPPSGHPGRSQPGFTPTPPPPVRGRPEPGPPGGADGGYPARIEWRESQPDAEVDRAASVLRRNLGMPRVLAFANPKGGVHKTTATVLAAATIGSVRGRGVLAWDDNELRGTLGLRAGSARHARTIRHLITDLVEIESAHGYELTDRLDDYLRHASDGSYDVLAGEESPRFAQRLDPQTVRRVLELLRRTHDVICVDTGNNVESANWQTVLQAADQLVVTCVPREDAAFTADWMLDLLHDVGMGDLVENAVTLLSCPTPGPAPLLEDLRRHFATRTRAVAVVPYDPALETGSSIEYPQLQPETRQAWLQAASVMLEPFVR